MMGGERTEFGKKIAFLRADRVIVRTEFQNSDCPVRRGQNEKKQPTQAAVEIAQT